MKNFVQNTSGNIAVTLTLIAAPLMMTAGAALDYTQLARKQSILQNVTDAAALAVAQDIKDLSKMEIEKRVETFVKSNLSPEHYAEIDKIKVKIPGDKSSLSVEASGQFPTTLMRIAGIPKINYERQSVVNVGSGSAEVVMVLDTTGSMSQFNKIGDLKVSASQFVESMNVSPSSDQIKIGIVPFARYVNVGLDNRNATWMDVPADYTATETRETREIISTGDCMQSVIIEFNAITIPDGFCNGIEYGPPTSEEVEVNYRWNGCAGSRKYPRNLNDEDFSFKVPGILRVGCPSRVTEMTNDKQRLLNAIDELQASGATYIPTGLVWGMRLLTHSEPFGEGVSFQEAADNNIQKVLILMSDGESVTSPRSDVPSLHSGSDLELTTQYTREVCNNIKSMGIKLFTIGFGTSIPADTLDLLKECSSNGNSYYNAADGDALTAAFENINGQLSSYYLSR